MANADSKKTQFLTGSGKVPVKKEGDSQTQPDDLFADLEATLDEVAESNPRLRSGSEAGGKSVSDLRELLEVSLSINSSLVLDDVLQMVMKKAIELMQAQRGFVMLLDDHDNLKVRSAYNLGKEEMAQHQFKISNSIAQQVCNSGRSIYTSDALSDERYAKQDSVVELHLRSIMCVPLKVMDTTIGVIYLDNSSEAKMFLKSDLYLFELYAQLVSNALHNAGIYDSLLNMKQYNEQVISNSPVGIVALNAHGQISTINSVALEIFDLNRDTIQVVGEDTKPSTFVELLPQEERMRWQNMINTALATGQEYSDPRYFHNTNYVEKALSLKISPVSGLARDEDGLIMTIEDTTEKVIMEKYVILSEKLVARGEMAASIAHELNNYMAIVANNAELLGMNIDRQKFDKAKFNAKSITENIHKIKRFVDNLMDFSKPETEFISYDMRHLIEDLLFSLRVQPRFKRTHFTIDLGQQIPIVEMDVGQIQQVLMNLLNNAADAIEERAIKEEASNDFKREISLCAEHDEEQETVHVTVTDNGIGMSEETLNKIFSAHFTTKKGGHGLGLANCKKIVESHHGEMWAESTEGEGTTFHFLLPRHQPQKSTANQTD